MTTLADLQERFKKGMGIVLKQVPRLEDAKLDEEGYGFGLEVKHARGRGYIIQFERVVHGPLKSTTALIFYIDEAAVDYSTISLDLREYLLTAEPWPQVALTSLQKSLDEHVATS